MFVTKAEKISCELLNQAASQNAASLVDLAESAYQGHLAQLCKDIILQQRHVVFVTGPSSSGKTTTAEELIRLLQRSGKRAVGISLDDFYLPKDQIPFWEEDGRPNFEALEALDLACISSCAQDLAQYGRTKLPVFNFAAGGRQEQWNDLFYDENTVLIIEGIHALNPKVTELFTFSESWKVYVSAHSDFVDSEGNTVLWAQDLRLVRRLLRDMSKRGVHPDETLQMWEDVCRGETVYIRPYRQCADDHVNSTHCYEPLLYKPYFFTLIDEAAIQLKNQEKIQQLKAAFTYFNEISPSLLPKGSMLREFLP